MDPLVPPGAPVDLRRVVLTGPESVGKTTLTERLAAHFGAPWVPEFVRGFAEARGTPPVAEDLGQIMEGQLALEAAGHAEATARRSPLLLLDTDLVSTAVYAAHYFGHCPPAIAEAAWARRADLYLLLDIDVPWVPDPVRDVADSRVEQLARFREALARLGAPVREVRGDWDARWRQGVEHVQALLSAAS